MRRLVATISLLGCASTAQISTAGSDGGPGGTTDARSDAPTVDAGPPPLASCAPERWRALPPVRVSGPDEQGMSYLQAAPTDDGAWVVYLRTSNSFYEDLRIARVTEDGAPHPVTRGATHLLPPLTTMDIGRRTLVSMLVTQDAVEMLVDGRDDIEPCVWARFALGATSATLRAVPRESTEHHLTRTVAGRSGYGLGRVGRWMSYHPPSPVTPRTHCVPVSVRSASSST